MLTLNASFQANILSCRIIIDVLEQGTHCFVFFLLQTLSKFLSNESLAGNSLTKKSYKNNPEFQEIITKQSSTQ